MLPGTATSSPLPNPTLEIGETEAPTQPTSTLEPSATPTSSSTPAPPTPTPPDPSSLPTRLYADHAEAWQLSPTSADGRYSVFSTKSEYLGTPNGPDSWDLYLRDNMQGATKLISVDEASIPLSNWNIPATISSDGSTVAFWAYPGHLKQCSATGSDTFCNDGTVFLYSVFTGIYQKIEVVGGYGLGLENDIDLSADGRSVAFAINHADKRPGVWVVDRGTGEFTQISPKGVGVDLSEDGRYVAYVAEDDGQIAEDQNQSKDVFLLDLRTGERTWVSRPRADKEQLRNLPSGFSYNSEGGGRDMRISEDGRYIVFSSSQVGLLDAPFTPCVNEIYTDWDYPECQHVYLYDRETDMLELISVSDDGTPGNRESGWPQVSPDGRFVAFISSADNLTNTGPLVCLNYEAWCYTVYLRDRQTGRTYLLSQSWHGRPPNGRASLIRFTPDGLSVIYDSDASDILPGLDPLPTPYQFRAVRLFVVDLMKLIEEK